MTEQQSLDLRPPAVILGPVKITLRRKTVGRQRRDEGIAQVLENAGDAWKARYLAEFELFAKERAPHGFLSEDFVNWFLARGNPKPHAPEAWSGMLAGLVRRKRIVWTGALVTMKGEKAHARITREWRAA